MKVCIHRGSKQIGGNCVEIESQGKRIVLDVGVPLDEEPEDAPLPPVKGFKAPDPSLLGVFISHIHPDHCALAPRLPTGTTFLISQAGRDILAAAHLFSPMGMTLDNYIPIEHRKPLTLGPFTLTHYLMDHSAFAAYSVLVEADGRRLFYTGDFRAHGRKGRLFDELIADPPRNVDILIMEGTALGRSDIDTTCPSEKDLEDQFIELFRNTKGMPLVWFSGLNIDRIVTIFKACKRSGRRLILDMYAAEILRATNNNNLPQAAWDEISIFLPKSQKARIVSEKRFDVNNRYRQHRIYPDQFAEAAQSSVMLFRPSMARDLDEADCEGCLKDARFICSMWRGYLEQDNHRPFRDWLERHQIPLDLCHTSGHATPADLRILRQSFPNAQMVPIHTENPSRCEKLFGNVTLRSNGEWWTI